VFVLGESHLYRVPREYAAYFNEERPHQGLMQKISCGGVDSTDNVGPRQRVRKPVLGGLLSLANIRSSEDD
jgi:hypothetical protein